MSSYAWFGIGSGLCFTVFIGFIAFNHDVPNAPELKEIAHSTTVIPAQNDFRDNTFDDELSILERSNFDSESERLEAKMLVELKILDREITEAKEILDRETKAAQQQEEKPALVLAKASMLLSELEAEGIMLSYDKTLLKPARIDREITAVETKIKGVELDLIDIEKRFNNLGNNTETRR